MPAGDYSVFVVTDLAIKLIFIRSALLSHVNKLKQSASNHYIPEHAFGYYGFGLYLVGEELRKDSDLAPTPIDPVISRRNSIDFL